MPYSFRENGTRATMNTRIVSDSAADLFEVPDVDYRTVPLKVMFGGIEYVDEPGTDFEQMVLDLQKHKGPSTTSCPNAYEWLDAFRGADEVFVVTLSSNLSGSYAAAEVAQQLYLGENPAARVHIFDSLATGPTMRLIIEKLRELVLAGNLFDQVVAETLDYQRRLRILYSLESLNNLARNGRVNKHVARIAGALNIRVIGHASEKGTVEIIHKARGEQRALKTIVGEMVAQGCTGGTVHIDHCLNESAAETLQFLIRAKIPGIDVQIHPCTALCSYYADKGGLIVGYEGAE